MTHKQNGYGVIKFKSPNTSQYQPVNAHRLRFMLFNETMDTGGMDVCITFYVVNTIYICSDLSVIYGVATLGSTGE